MSCEFGTKRHSRPDRHAQGYLANLKHPPPWKHHRSLGIGLLYGPVWGGVPYERGTPVHTTGTASYPERLTFGNPERQTFGSPVDMLHIAYDVDGSIPAFCSIHEQNVDSFFWANPDFFD